MLVKTTIKPEIMLVTPALAEKWLEGNTHNRPVKDGLVNEYASQMKRKLWLLNGEAIIFDHSGRLMDGQHRLWACITSETSFETLVVRGVDPEVFTTIDTGAKRTAGDVLHIAGHTKYVTTLAAASMICLEYIHDVIKAKGKIDSRKNRSITRKDVLKYVEKNPRLMRWVEMSRTHRGWTATYSSTIAAVLYLGSNKFPQKAEEFMHGWLSGESLTIKSPILALRNRLATEKRLAKSVRVGLVASAWNAYASGRELTIIKAAKVELTIKGAER